MFRKLSLSLSILIISLSLISCTNKITNIETVEDSTTVETNNIFA